jgi:dGTPase
MKEKILSSQACNENNPKWEKAISRKKTLYRKEEDIRSDFSRDFNRILHSKAYRRLKHKTQVFFATKNDHICTRIEHVNHVSAITKTISDYLGLNTELSAAIALGHDLGHSPFGHDGESFLHKIAAKEYKGEFWHEKNSLHFVDNIETLANTLGEEYNLSLTYAVRDGILCHCGEVDQQELKPRSEFISLEMVTKGRQPQPYTWEGCVVKIADKIAYLGRDIEDAIALNILEKHQLQDIESLLYKNLNIKLNAINNTTLIHHFIMDICENSSIEKGICFSDKYYALITAIKDFNYKNIYEHHRLDYYNRYAELIIQSIFDELKAQYNAISQGNFNNLTSTYPLLASSFIPFCKKYCFETKLWEKQIEWKNQSLYDIQNSEDYYKLSIDFISGMSDYYAIKIFDELTKF